MSLVQFYCPERHHCRCFAIWGAPVLTATISLLTDHFYPCFKPRSLLVRESFGRFNSESDVYSIVRNRRPLSGKHWSSANRTAIDKIKMSDLLSEQIRGFGQH
ncbi:uncharacterized protein BDW43DRAFT_271961 [Aspergillus alliaceus]|uniref:uncharacterized protein n=1 Tax=Petromyces alliaceus TaxID=209559 RepID=UPI0012A640BD|nr:uncharacterized protein BDW43DRAFT_271961 [Aspergillus alliaceus]KAB8234942.1 hypothetical protein BDW43DRAFT_271961 [Aspergillus alliaceus]